LDLSWAMARQDPRYDTGFFLFYHDPHSIALEQIIVADPPVWTDDVAYTRTGLGKCVGLRIGDALHILLQNH